MKKPPRKPRLTKKEREAVERMIRASRVPKQCRPAFRRFASRLKAGEPDVAAMAACLWEYARARDRAA